MNDKRAGPTPHTTRDRAKEDLDDRLPASHHSKTTSTCQASMADVWCRVSPQEFCPVCGHDTWCSVSGDGVVVICMRETSQCEIDCGGAGQGWLHRLHDDGRFRRYRRSRSFKIREIHDFGEQVAAGRKATTKTLFKVHAKSLGVPVEALHRLGAFVDPNRHYLLCFPMRFLPGGTIVGVRVRDPQTRKKWSWRGSRGDALFVPDSLGDGDLYVAEGPTDTAALLGLGLDAIGRPNATGGVAWISRASVGRNVVVVADGDVVGRQGAMRAAQGMMRAAKTIRTLLPPKQFEDAREWVAAGATAAEIRRGVQE